MVGEARQTHVNGRVRTPAAQRRFVIAPQVTERLAVNPLEDPRPGVRHAPRRGIGQRGDRRGAEPVREVLMESETVGVRAEASRPVQQPAVDAVDWRRQVPAGRLVDDCTKAAVMQSSLARNRAFFIRREAFDLPDRQIQIREDEGLASEHGTQRARPALRSIEMRDVRELVGEHEPQPVVEVADELRPGRPRGVDHDRVVGHGRGRAVGLLGLIDENNMRQRRRPDAQRLLQSPPGILGDDAESAGESIFALVEMDDEMRRAQRAKPERGIEQRGRLGGHAVQHRANEQRADQPVSGRHFSET